jgi:hypothetical protein
MKKPKPKKAMREGHAVTTLSALSVRMKSKMTYICTCMHVGPQGQDRFISTGSVLALVVRVQTRLIEQNNTGAFR